MLRGVAAALVAAVVMAGAWIGGADSARAAASPFVPCQGTSGVLCGNITVPLDWSGAVPGTVTLAAEELPAQGTPRGVMMLLAGGPGQASAVAFDLADLGPTWQGMFPGYTLVAFDPRGTGNSGFLGCIVGADPVVAAAQIATCGQSIGANRVYYTTTANADDIDAVRQAVGVDKVALWGTSYGTKVALAYAAAFPTHVERLLLDSVVPTTGPDPLGLDTLEGIPLGLSALCGNAACKKVSPNLATEVATLANRAAVTPIRGKVRTASGRLVPVSMDGITLLGVVVSADLDPGLQASLPSAVADAVDRRPQALLRLAGLSEGGFRSAADEPFSEGLFYATMCADGRFPWQPNDDLTTRQSALAAAVSALEPGATGPFGSWATELGSASYCITWPSPAGNAPIAAGPLPDVPVLALSGTIDTRTPTANAAAVVSQFPQGHLLVVPGIGHSVLTADPDSCPDKAVQLWLAGGTPPTRCTSAPAVLAGVPKIPASVTAAPLAPRTSGVRGRMLSVVTTTVQDAFATEVTAGEPIGGLAGGRASPGTGTLILSKYSDVSGVTVSGTLRITTEPKAPLAVPSGSVTVNGPKAARGVVTFSRTGVKVTWSK
ncbi:MAG TPA: alpha/beta fold hydrolase [Gaiellaceae bacterium]|nr:alpha/beta fold hydrolase [Gaiellaceae bacterium]